jgi:predicted RNA-binding Zn-ribbon protein involved in translation (DUF1610 family)
VTAPPPTPETGTTTPLDGKLVDWPCKKCRHPQTIERADDTVYDDHHYRCPACNHAWWEEGADA